MKKIIIALLVIVVAYFIALFVIKGKADEELQRQVDLINQQVGVKATVTESSKGMFKGVDKIQLSIDTSDSIQNIAVLTNEYYYGPVMLTEKGLKFGLLASVARVQFDEYITGELPETVDLDNRFIVHSLAGFSGHFSADLDFNGLRFSDSVMQMELAPAQFTVSGSSDYSKMSGEGTWKGMTGTAPSGEVFSMTDLTLSLNQTLLAGDIFAGNAIYEGDADYRIASFEMSDGSEGISLSNLQISGSSIASNSEKTAIDVKLKMTAEEFVSPEQKFTDSRFDMTLKNLDVATLQEFMALVQAISEATSQGLDASMYQMQIMNLGMQLVQKGPGLEISDSQVVTQHGPITLNMNVNVAGEKIDPANMMTMMTAVDAKLNAEGPRRFFELLDMGSMIEQNIQQNMIIDDNGTLKIEATFNEGNLLVNGQQMPGMMM